MPRHDIIRILAAFGGGEPLDITPHLAEYPSFLTMTVGFAQSAARWDLVQRLADCGEIEDDEQKRRRLLELVGDAVRLDEAFDEEADRTLCELGAWATRWLEAADANRAKNFRVVGESKAAKPRSKPIRSDRGRLGATGASEAANGKPAEPDADDGRQRPRPEPVRQARGPVDRRRRKPEAPRE